jgi:outer membrane protein assembly factor BamB
VLGLEVQTGKQLWQLEVGGELGAEPVATGTATAILAVRPETYLLLDAKHGTQRWRFKRPGVEGISVRGQAPAEVDFKRKRVYVGLSSGEVAALSLDHGDGVWITAVGKKNDPFPDVDARPILTRGGKELLVASYNGGVARLDANNGQVLWRDDKLKRITAAEAPPESRWAVLSHGDGEVIGVSKDSGQVRWRYRLKRGSPSPPRSLGHGLVAVASTDGPVAILDASSGRPVQLVAPGQFGFASTPFARGQDLVLFSNYGVFVALRFGEGSGVSHTSSL